MTDNRTTELYEQAQDWLTFARRRHERGDVIGETIALYKLKTVVKILRKPVDGLDTWDEPWDGHADPNTQQVNI